MTFVAVLFFLVPAFAVLSASSFPPTLQCTGFHCKVNFLVRDNWFSCLGDLLVHLGWFEEIICSYIGRLKLSFLSLFLYNSPVAAGYFILVQFSITISYPCNMHSMCCYELRDPLHIILMCTLCINCLTGSTNFNKQTLKKGEYSFRA